MTEEEEIDVETEDIVEDFQPDDDEVEEIEEYDLSDVEYGLKNLEEWEKDFTIFLPSLPCTANEIFNCMVDLNNNYQRCYNIYTRLLVLSSRAEGQYKLEKFRLVDIETDKLKAAGVKRMPSRDNLEIKVQNDPKNTTLRSLRSLYRKFSAIKDFFENHKHKLEKSMLVAERVSFHIGANDRAVTKAGYYAT